LVVLPYFVVKYYQRSQRISHIVESLAQGSRDLQQMTRLMEGPVQPWVGEQDVEELRVDEKTETSGFLVLQDLRIVDLRNWTPTASVRITADNYLYGYRRLKVQKRPENTTNNLFRVSVLAYSPETQIRFPPQQLTPKLYSRGIESSASGEKLVHWQVGADFLKVPPGDSVDIIYEHLSPGTFLREGAGTGTLTFEVEAETVELSRCLLLPKGKEYESFRLIRYQTGKPEASENVKVVTEYLAEDSSILAFKLLSIKPGYTYDITWFYR
jgi:hypothetical protein